MLNLLSANLIICFESHIHLCHFSSFPCYYWNSSQFQLPSSYCCHHYRKQ